MMCAFFLGLLMMFLIARGTGWRGFRRRGRHGWCAGRGEGRAGVGWGRRRMMDWLFSKLDTSHGQEKVIREAVDEVEEALRSTRGLGRKHVRNVADALRGPDFGHDGVAEVWAEQDQALERVRMAVLNALQSVHGVLEPEQRDKLADLVERRFPMGHRGPAW